MNTLSRSLERLHSELIASVAELEQYTSDQTMLFGEVVTTALSLEDLAALLVTVLGVSMTPSQVDLITTNVSSATQKTIAYLTHQKLTVIPL